MQQCAGKRRRSEPNLLHSKRVRSEYAVSPPPAETNEDHHGNENQLELDLWRISRRHNLTKRNVHNILREVITHERVVDMMKAAIRDTHDLPLFEPKMTRSRLKKAVEQGQKVNWSLSAVSSCNRGFVDMELEEEEDSSDEEYCPHDEEEDTDELFLSDGDSLTSPPRAPPGFQTRAAQCLAQCPVLAHTQVTESTHFPNVKACPSQTDSFLERLNAVDEELNSNPAYYYQAEESLACRTRSKLTLVDVPITRLEAELLAPDISADMSSNPTHQATDPHWTQWLQGLVAPDNTDEAEDEDDPEYNFLEDLDEPDLEDYRTDRAVQITKKEVNELLEELFDTLQEQDEDEEQEEPDEEESFKLGLDLLEAPLQANVQAVRRQSQTRRALQDTTNTSQVQVLSLPPNQVKNQEHVAQAQLAGSQQLSQLIQNPESTGPSLKLSEAQRRHLQQQIQQHVQLLTQVHLLTKGTEGLKHEADITKLFLVELDQFSCHRSSFNVCNLPLALELIEEDTNSALHRSAPVSGAAADSKRWLPSMTPATNGHAFPLLLAQLAWLFATRPVFMYPELLPVCSLDPAHHAAHKRQVYTQGEDGLVVLALKHFEGTVNPDHLITDFLLCKTRSNFTKHIREFSSNRAPPNVIKSFFASGRLPCLPLACSRVDPLDLRPPVDRDCSQSPNWLKNSRDIIQKTRSSSSPPSYPQSLPIGCMLRLHPHWLAKGRFPLKQPKRRLFTLAHNSTLLPLAKKHGTLDVEELNGQNPGEDGILLTHQTCSSMERLKDCQPEDAASGSTPRQNVLLNPEAHLPKHAGLPVLLPVASKETVPLGQPSAAGPATQQITPNSAVPLEIPHSLCPGVFMVHMVLDAIPSSNPVMESDKNETKRIDHKDTAEKKQPKKYRSIKEMDRNQRGADYEGEGANEGHTVGGGAKKGRTGGANEGGSTNSGRGAGEERGEGVNVAGGANERGSANSGGEADEERGEGANETGGTNERGSANSGGEVDEERGEGANETGGANERGSANSGGGAGEERGEGANEAGGANERGSANSGGGAGEERGEGAIEAGGANERGSANSGGGANEKCGEEEEANEGQRPSGGGDSGGGGPGEGGGDDGGDDEEEEEEFDDFTQDEDEEEVMSSASEESVLSVPELQETMKQLTWLATERRPGDCDSEEDLSQEDEEEDEEDGNSKGDESREERGSEVRDKESTVGEDATRRANTGPARGRGRSRPPRKLKCRRQDRISKDASKLLLLYDENILENDPLRDSKDTAFAQSYLNRVQEALQDVPLKMEEFVSLLGEFEKIGEMQDVVTLFRKLQCILGPRTDLLRDFAAFLRPEQALECGLFNEQQAFDRSRRFLRQLEISFGDNPSHYQKIIKALQMGPDLSPTSVHELKSQMTCLLKGHTHLQSELWVFFDELRPPPARPGQFEEAQWPEAAEGRGGSGGGDMSSFEEVTLPELDEEDDRHKIQPITVRQPRRKMDAHKNYKSCDCSEKSWVCLCDDIPNQKHKKKGCRQCKRLVAVSRAMKSLHPLYSQMTCDKDPSPFTEQSVAIWEGPFLPPDEDDEDMTETKRELLETNSEEISVMMEDMTESSPSSVLQPDVSQNVAPALSQELTRCAKNISLTASGEKVVLWTREADRVILTWCQQEGANPTTFHHISTVLGNKTPCQVSQRFQDLMRLFHTTA